MNATNVLRGLSGLIGLLFLVQAIGWLTDPQQAAAGLGMPLLDGLARSTQVGDLGAFFSSLAGMIGIGVIRRRAPWLQAAAMLLGAAAVVRTLAWAVHGAELATSFIAIEAVCMALLLFTAARFASGTDPA